MTKLKYLNIKLHQSILWLAVIAAAVIAYFTSRGATTKTAQVEPGSRETVTYEQVDPGGEYQLKIEEKDPDKYTVKKSDFKAQFKGNTLWQKQDKKNYSVAAPQAVPPPAVGVKGTFDQGGGGAGASPTPSDFEVDVHDVTIEVNKTADTSDDIVQMKDTLTGTFFSIACRAKADGGSALTAVITSPDGRLKFPSASTATLSLPADGSWVEFSIAGEKPSDAIGDAVIEAREGAANGRMIGRMPATVFHFEPADMTVGQGGMYVLADNANDPALLDYDVHSTSYAANLRASATLAPRNLSISAPQFQKLGIGILQNASQAYYAVEYAEPQAVWPDAVPSGSTVAAPLVITEYDAFEGPLIDVPNRHYFRFPLYGDIETAPKPMPGSEGEAEGGDRPSMTEISKITEYPFFTTDGQHIVPVRYTFHKCLIQLYLTDWCVAFEPFDENVPPNWTQQLREHTWNVVADSTKSNQKAHIAATDTDPTFIATEGGITANEAGEDPAYNGTSSSAETISLQKP